jgi:glutamine amidotransferase
MRRVSIVDYGVGNLFSLARAIEWVGGEAVLVRDADAVRMAERLLLPGVGAFGHCATALKTQGLTEAVIERAGDSRPFLGICVGMQLMLDASFEFGCHRGMGVIAGVVEPIPRERNRGRRKIPHVGWKELSPAAGADWSGSALAGIEPRSQVYFVHSFTARPESETDIFATTDYDGCPIVAAVGRGAQIGVQFHPEKSGPVGLQILANFLSL